MNPEHKCKTCGKMFHEYKKGRYSGPEKEECLACKKKFYKAVKDKHKSLIGCFHFEDLQNKIEKFEHYKVSIQLGENSGEYLDIYLEDNGIKIMGGKGLVLKPGSTNVISISLGDN